MSHLIPNLKCHIERVSSLYIQGGDNNEKNINGKLTLKKLLTHYTLTIGMLYMARELKRW